MSDLKNLVLVSTLATVFIAFVTFGQFTGAFSVIPVSFDTSEIIVDHVFNVFGSGSTTSGFIDYVAPSGTVWEVSGMALEMTANFKEASIGTDSAGISGAPGPKSEQAFDPPLRTKNIKISYTVGGAEIDNKLHVVIAGRLVAEQVGQMETVPQTEPVPQTDSNSEWITNPIEGAKARLSLLSEEQPNLLLVLVAISLVGVLGVLIYLKRR